MICAYSEPLIECAPDDNPACIAAAAHHSMTDRHVDCRLELTRWGADGTLRVAGIRFDMRLVCVDDKWTDANGERIAGPNTGLIYEFIAHFEVDGIGMIEVDG